MGLVDDIVAADDGGAVGRLKNRGEHPQSRCLAGPVCAKKPVNLARLADKADVVDRADRATLFVVEDLAQTSSFDHERALDLGNKAWANRTLTGIRSYARKHIINRVILRELRAQRCRVRLSSLVTVGALLGIELIQGHTKDIVALNANPVKNGRLRGCSGSGIWSGSRASLGIVGHGRQFSTALRRKDGIPRPEWQHLKDTDGERCVEK